MTTASTTASATSTFDQLIIDLATVHHPALRLAHTARSIAAQRTITSRQLTTLRLMRSQAVALHNASQFTGYRLLCRRLIHLIDTLGVQHTPRPPHPTLLETAHATHCTAAEVAAAFAGSGGW